VTRGAEVRRVGVYCRISEDRDGEGAGVERQRGQCEELAGQLGWVVVDYYIDNDISASSGKLRKHYGRLMGDLRSGRIDAVIAWHTDRLHRRPDELEPFITLVESCGALVRTVKAGELDFSTASGRMVARMLGVIARHEIEHMVERIVAKKSEQAAGGEYRGSGRPFGYEGRPANGAQGVAGMVVRQDEAQELREAARRILVGGQTPAAVRDWWNERGVVTSCGNRWTTRAVVNVLVRPRNAALIEHEGQIVGPAQWPGVLEEETWAGLRDKLGDGSPKRSYRPRSQRLLAGIARCGWVDSEDPESRECGEPMISGGRKANGQPRYICRTRQHFTRLAEPLEDYVAAFVVARLSAPDAVQLLAGPPTQRSASLHTRAAAVRAKLDALSSAFMDDAIDPQQLRVGTKKGRDELVQIEAELAAQASDTVLIGIAGKANAAEIWVDSPMERRRAILDALADVTLLAVPRGGRGGTAGFNPATVRITPR
jgi:site-specific DNA recombinase